MPTQQNDVHPLFAILNAIEVDAGVLAYVNSLGDQGRAQLVDVATNAKERLTPTERARAIFLLGQLRWRPAFDPLRKLLHDESARVRLSTLYALSKIDAPHAVPLLLETIKDLKSGISERGHALRCLSDIGDEETIKELETWVEDVKSIELKRLARNTIMQLSLGLKRLKFD
jgi:hypothetical protein